MTASDDPDDLPTEDAPTDPIDEIPWRGLHPLSLVVNLLPRTWRVIRTMWPLFLAVLLQGRRDSASVLDLAIVSFFFLSSIGGTLVHFLTLRYRVVGGRLEIKSGLFNRQNRVIDPERIQNIELVRNVFHKAAGLVEVRIETASGRDVEGLLSALSEARGADLIRALGRARRRPEAADTPPRVLQTAGVPELLQYGATGMRVGAGMAIVFGVVAEAIQWMGPEELDDVPDVFGTLGVGLFAVAFVSGLYVVAVATALLRFWNFELLQVGDRLVASSGLLTRRRVELPLAKVQLVTVREPIVRRALSFGSMLIETAAAREESGGTATAEAVVPVVYAEDIGAVIGEIIPSEPDLWSRPLRPPHPLALRRGLIGATIRGLILGGVIAGWLWPWGLLAVPVLVGGGAIAAWFDFRYQGWLLTDRVLVARRGFIDRQTGIVSRDKVQAVEVRQGPILRRWGLGKVVVRVAGSTLALPLVGEAEALELLEALRPRRSVSAGGAASPA